jgi:hypothetical protein
VTDVTPMKEDKAKPGEKDVPSKGIFGFAGSTLFQPGQPLFDPESGVLPFKPKGSDKTPA